MSLNKAGKQIRIRLLLAFGMLAVAFSIGISATGAFAGVPIGNVSQSNAAPTPTLNDGFDALPFGLKGISYSTLAHMGRVHYNPPWSPKDGTGTKPFSPLLNIVWGVEHNTSTVGAGEPAAGMHPTNPNYALVSGNVTIDNTTDGGATWAERAPPNAAGYGDVVNAWLGPSFNSGLGAIEAAINPTADGSDYTLARSTDGGVTWANDATAATTIRTIYFDDREYLWSDYTPTSPFYQRVYLTGAMFDSGGTGSFNSVTLKWSSDGGTTWHPDPTAPIALVPNNEFALGTNHNEYPSLGIRPDGTIGYAWHRGRCCGVITTVPNKVMFARSTDGGVSFPFSTTIVTVPVNQSVEFNSTSPLGVRWSDTPNITADPNDGTFYAIWTQYRTANTSASAAIYLSKSTDNGVTWSAPVIPFNNPNPNLFQGFGWVKVTPDHAVHVTYLGGVVSNTTVAQYYVQSTDRGVTWSTPFQLSSTTFGPFGTTTDYESVDAGAYTGGGGSILTTWAESSHFARLGTFVLGTPTPTFTGTPPTATRTPTLTVTPTITSTPCGTSANYTVATATATIAAGTADIGNHTDDGATLINLPFTYNLYGQPFTSASASSNGQLDFLTADAGFTNVCLPDTAASFAIFPHWDDMRTDQVAGSNCPSYGGVGCGIFTSVTGVSPNRIFNIEWRAVYFDTVTNLVNFEVRLYENQSRFDLVYGTVVNGGGPHGTDPGATVGVQRDTGSLLTQYECNTAGTLSSGLLITFTQPSCGTATPTPSPTCNPNGAYNVLVVSADCSSPETNLINTLLAEPGIASVTLFDAQAGTPSLAQLQQYQIVVPFSDCGYFDQTTLGNNLDAYESGGGIVVALNFDWYGSTQSIAGTWQTNDSPFNNNATVNFVSGTLGTCTFAPLCSGVTTLQSFYREIPTLASGATAAGTWNDGSLMMAYKGRTVGISGYFGDSSDNYSGQIARLVANTGRWLSPPSLCLTSTPTITPTRTRTPTNTPTNTSTPTITSTPVLIGHMTWQGRTAQPSSDQIMPFTLTLKSVITEVNYPPYLVTDASGFFTMTLTGLPTGAYNWRVKGPSYLATAGSFTLVGGINNVEMGTQKDGDITGDNLCSSTDFVQLKNNFGFGGAPPIGPSKP